MNAVLADNHCRHVLISIYHALVLPCSWTVELFGAEGTLYEGEQFQLNFKFNHKYPFDAPQVSHGTSKHFFHILEQNISGENILWP